MFRPTRTYEPPPPTIGRKPVKTPVSAPSPSSSRTTPSSSTRTPAAAAQAPAPPAGSAYQFKIVGARIVHSRGCGSAVRIDAKVASGEQGGCLVSNALFPFSRPGLRVLIACTLGENWTGSAHALAKSLPGTRFGADVIHLDGQPLLRNIHRCDPEHCRAHSVPVIVEAVESHLRGRVLTAAEIHAATERENSDA